MSNQDDNSNELNNVSVLSKITKREFSDRNKGWKLEFK